MKKLLWFQFAITSLAIFWIFTPTVQAQEVPNLPEDSGIAMIAKGIGTLDCSNGIHLENMEIFVLLSETTTNGLGTSPSGMGLKSQETNQNIAIKLSSGNVSSETFFVEGVLQVDDLCELDSTTIFTANGSCGNDKIITVKGSDGSLGIFQSTVTCNSIG